MTIIGMVLFYLVFFAKVKSEEIERCEYNNVVKKIICKCDTRKILEFSSAEQNINSIEIRDCDSVNVDIFAGLTVDKVKEWTIENIANSLIFEPTLVAYELLNFKLSNIGEIPFIKKESFDQLVKIDNFKIENTRILSLEDIFGEHPVNQFTLINVTIENLLEFNLINGKLLNITNCKIKVVRGPLVFEKFENIEISETIFEFSNPGNISFVGKKINLNKNAFLNATVQVVASENIDVRGTCGNGRSSMRLDAPDTTSHGNKLPSQIVYVKKPRNQSGNGQCSGGYCNCSRMSDTKLNKNQAATISCSSLFLLTAFIFYFSILIVI